MESPQEIDSRYQESLADLRALIHYAHAISSSVGGREVSDERHWYAAAIFSKVVSQSITLHRSLPKGLTLSDAGEAVLWDLASACCIARAVMEAYDALAYIAVHPESDSEAALRIKVWELHDKERRGKMLRLIGSTSPMVQEIEKEAELLRSEVLSEPLVSALHKSIAGKVRSRETPDFLVTLQARCGLSDVNYDYYVNAKMFLSAHVHTHPFAVHQLMNFRAGDPVGLVLLSLPARYAVVFLAKAIEGMAQIFGSAVPQSDQAMKNIMNIWIGVAKNGVTERGAS